jgi:hypothetical protein
MHPTVTGRMIALAAATPFAAAGLVMVIIAVREAGRVLQEADGIVADPDRLPDGLLDDAAPDPADVEYLDRLALGALPPIDPFEANRWARQFRHADPGQIIDEATR